MSDIKNYEAIEWALECMNHYSECDIPDEDRVAITEAKTIISTFINTIESQKEEIQNQRNVIVKQGKLINSQQAITELAVKGLREIVKGDESYHTTIFEARDWIDKIEVIADTTLSEIERLSQ